MAQRLIDAVWRIIASYIPSERIARIVYPPMSLRRTCRRMAAVICLPRPCRGLFVFDMHNVIQADEDKAHYHVLSRVITEWEASALASSPKTSFPWLYKRHPPLNETYLAYACNLLRRADFKICLLSYCHEAQQQRSLTWLADNDVDSLFDELVFCTARTWADFAERPKRKIHTFSPQPYFVASQQRTLQCLVHVGPKASALRYLANAIPSETGCCCMLDDRLEIVHDVAVTCRDFVVPLWYDHKRTRAPRPAQAFLADEREHAQRLRNLEDDLARCSPDQTPLLEGAEIRTRVHYICGPREVIALVEAVSAYRLVIECEAFCPKLFFAQMLRCIVYC